MTEKRPADSPAHSTEDATLAREIEGLLAVDPSPEFLARVRTRLAEEPPRRRWSKFLLTGSIRLPVPAVVAILAILLVMAGALIRQRTPAPPVPSSINLVDFRPVDDPNVRVIRAYEPN